MAYEKNNWQSGDVVTSDKLNHMEDGIESSNIPIFHYTDNPATASADMYAFIMANKDKPFYIYDDSEQILMRTILSCWADPESNDCEVSVLDFDGEVLHIYRYISEQSDEVVRGSYAVWDTTEGSE